jgi:hypothetical protein
LFLSCGHLANISLPEASHGWHYILTYPDDILFSISIEDRYHFPPIGLRFGLRHAAAPYRTFIGACLHLSDQIGSPPAFIDDPDYEL